MTSFEHRARKPSCFVYGAAAPGDREVEFVRFDEVEDLLADYGIEQVREGEEQVHLRMHEGEGVVHLHLACGNSGSKPLNGATVIPVEKQRLPQVVEHILHLLHLNQLLLIPVGKWRKVFDAVAFSLAQNEDWQAMDATATVELNTRDPLLCEPADFHTLIALIQALVNDAESPDQGLAFIATGSPVLVEVVPDGTMRISLGSQVLADEIAEAFVN
jgi:hypothetical protein